MYRIKIDVSWRAAHRLLNYQGKCSSLHGEFYTASFWFEGERLDEADILLDFGVMKKKIKEWIDSALDHATILNEKDDLVPILRQHGQKIFIMPSNPTAEKLAQLLFEVVSSAHPYAKLTQVKARESTEDSEAYYTKTEGR